MGLFGLMRIDDSGIHHSLDTLSPPSTPIMNSTIPNPSPSTHAPSNSTTNTTTSTTETDADALNIFSPHCPVRPPLASAWSVTCESIAQRLANQCPPHLPQLPPLPSHMSLLGHMRIHENLWVKDIVSADGRWYQAEAIQIAISGAVLNATLNETAAEGSAYYLRVITLVGLSIQDLTSIIQAQKSSLPATHENHWKTWAIENTERLLRRAFLAHRVLQCGWQ
ncbi:hypothetical protein SprV_0602058200 [Sparganum proliferum]